MGKHYLREDKTCENCGHIVEIAYCSNCGQKNTETRQSFGHLITHFIEDLVHYDSAFWKTIKYLLFNPAKLTKAYLSGKRQTYVAPVKLYIFVSFITFFIIAVLPGVEETPVHDAQHTEANIEDTNEIKKAIELPNGEEINSVEELDSIQTGPVAQRMHWIEYSVIKAVAMFVNNEVDYEDFAESFIHNLPKVLFIYMPIFAFWLWLFHGKKRWYFFDHGIYTLHYFSFLLLSFLTASLIATVVGLMGVGSDTYYSTYIILIFITFLYAVFYFFRSHRRMYGESRLVSRLKSIILFLINSIFILILLVITMFYTILHLH
ncbi:DUF3667 domain-containing protein [Flavobacterium salilacus subsp. salilacus]|uniref:DUF3667 domain-containing protein n=1 Tax=Flavobacterium TaxID=237 RepID=UPI001074C305|nr:MULTISPECIES: DUF3667 domain-containing protein [Flavobacterium]KAF2519292.1 DUF3667 domain-containing protein [Flavobacterium salilacus subsp. salilacus]MBE1613481.1 DUF3667 domain-containing protein [Flavobacterium sp. SaA2.13]